MTEEPKGSEPAHHLPYVAVLRADPGLADPDEARLNFVAHLKMAPKAFILEGYATGGTPETLNPFIRECKDRGIPVFILSANYARNTGIQKVSYGPQAEAVKAGAIPLRDVNMNGILEVVGSIQTAVNQGLSGDKLANAVVDQFNTIASRPLK